MGWCGRCFNPRWKTVKPCENEAVGQPHEYAHSLYIIGLTKQSHAQHAHATATLTIAPSSRNTITRVVMRRRFTTSSYVLTKHVCCRPQPRVETRGDAQIA